MVSIDYNQALAISITHYWDPPNRKNTPFSITIIVFEETRVDPSKQAALFKCQTLAVVVFDHGLGCDSHKDLRQKGSKYSSSIFGCMLYHKSSRQWVWDLLVDREESI